MQVTKLKSQQVLQLLQRGYDVLFSDVDVVWFSDPLPAIQASYAEDALLVQSNEPNMAKPDNGLLRVNSGWRPAFSCMMLCMLSSAVPCWPCLVYCSSCKAVLGCAQASTLCGLCRVPCEPSRRSCLMLQIAIGLSSPASTMCFVGMLASGGWAPPNVGNRGDLSPASCPDRCDATLASAHHCRSRHGSECDSSNVVSSAGCMPKPL